MKQASKYRLTLPVSLSLLFLFSGCASNIVRDWPAAEGVVLDVETGQPIAGVVVEARWEGNAGFSTTMCFHVEDTYTDQNGRFYFPTWYNKEASFYKEPYQYFAFHKAGYQLVQRNYHAKTYKKSSYHEGIYYLEKDTRSKVERLNSFRYPYICSYDEQNQWPMAKSLFLELETLGGDTRRLAASIEDSILDNREWSRVYTPEILDNAHKRIKQKIAEEDVQ